MVIVVEGAEVLDLEGNSIGRCYWLLLNDLNSVIPLRSFMKRQNYERMSIAQFEQ